MSLQNRPLLAIFLFLLIGAGCGQKGVLYLPDDPSQMEVIESAETGSEGSPADNPEADGDDEDEEDDAEAPAAGAVPGEGNPNE